MGRIVPSTEKIDTTGLSGPRRDWIKHSRHRWKLGHRKTGTGMGSRLALGGILFEQGTAKRNWFAGRG